MRAHDRRVEHLDQVRGRTHRGKRAYGALIGMVAVLLVVGMLKPSFLSYANVGNVLRQSAVLIILSFGLTFVLILRGVDLSVAQTTDATAIAAAALLIHGQPVWMAFAAPCSLGRCLASSMAS
jgi:ribose/xylose/arabinose/galactoside ABC-type transport system permease subunit